jgi:membrane fusion protein, multidrug efflux system
MLGNYFDHAKTAVNPRQSLYLLFMLGMVLTLSACGKGEQTGDQAPPHMAMPVTTIEMQGTTVPISAEAVAQTEGAKEVEIRARVGGILLKRLYEEGAAVKAGQAMFLIDPVPYEIALAQAKAQLAEQQARIEQAQREQARLKSLLDTQSISQREYDNAASDESIARAALLSAQARVREAELNLSYTRVEAPVSGIAGRFAFSEGALIEANASLLTTIVQISPIWVRFSLSENELAHLGGRLNEKNVRKVELIMPDGKDYPEIGELNFAASQIDPLLGTQQLRATFENANQQLLPGQFVRARVTTGEYSGVFLVPQMAVMSSDQGKFVYVVNEKSEATVRPVKVGDWVGTDWIILEGLNVGDRVIVDNLIKLRPGVPVAPNSEKTPEQSDVQTQESAPSETQPEPAQSARPSQTTHA